MRKVSISIPETLNRPSLSSGPQANPISESSLLQDIREIWPKGVNDQELSISKAITGTANIDPVQVRSGNPTTRERQAVLWRLPNILNSPIITVTMVVR